MRLSFLFRVIILGILLGALACALAEQPQGAQKFVRVRRDAAGAPLALETSIVSYVSKKDSGLRVDLVSAVHVAEASYYQALSAKFRSYDAVLYELIAPKETRPQVSSDSALSTLSMMQHAIKDVLQLEFQLDGIDYHQTNFVHADMSPDEFFDTMKSRDESFLKTFLRVIAISSAKGSDSPLNRPPDFKLLLALFGSDRTYALRKLMAEQFESAEEVMSMINGPEGSTLVTERNKVALKVLADQISKGKKRIAIFYGGAHMPHMEQQLLGDFQMQERSIEWLNAWKLANS
ncbi:MAG: hypothetical protein DCC75_08140 [Proteobacteria bacterium]|nr:MAG: hypothetical protein DCC75_08140 [Pseudomonadota bacterium]